MLSIELISSIIQKQKQKQLYETVCRHSLFVNAVEIDFHILASSVINVHARINFYARVIIEFEPRGICIFQTILCMSDIEDYFVG